MAHFERHHPLLTVDVELVGRADRIRRLLIVVEHELAANRGDLRRVRDAEAPSRLVDLVNALVADVAVPGIPEPMPVVMEAVLRERALRCRAEPEVVIDAGRHRLDGRLADGVAPLVAEPARHVQLTDLAAAHAFDRLAQRRVRSVLAALLDHAVVLAGRGDDLLRLEDVVRARLLDVDVLACLAGPDRLQRVPVIRRGNRHGVDVLALEHLAEVRVHRRSADAFRVERIHLVADVGFVHIAEPGDLHVLHRSPRAHVRAASPAQTGDADPDGVIRALHAANHGVSRDDGSAHEEMSSIHGDSFPGRRGRRRADSATRTARPRLNEFSRSPWRWSTDRH